MHVELATTPHEPLYFCHVHLCVNTGVHGRDNHQRAHGFAATGEPSKPQTWMRKARA